MLGVSNFDILSSVSAINANDLKTGISDIETYPHVTLMYGFTNILDKRDMNDLESYFQNMSRFNLSSSKIGFFLNEKSGISVLKYDIDMTDKLMNMRKECEKYDHKKLHDGYKPHLTIAYLKLGRHDKYIKSLQQPIDIQVDSVKISWGDMGSKIMKL